MLYNNIYTTNDLLNVLVSEEDGYTLKRVNRRKLDDRKDGLKGNSCFRKGYHKYERDWKKSTRRNRRHEGKDYIRQQMTATVSDEAICQYAEDLQFFDDGHRITKAVGSWTMPNYNRRNRLKELEGWWIYVRVDNWAVDLPIDYDPIDDIELRNEWVYISIDDAINMGLVE